MSQPKIRMYVKKPCPYCDRAEALFKSRGLQFEKIDLTDQIDELLRLKDHYGHATVPMILINDEFIGGYTDLVAAIEAGKLQL